VQNRFNIIPDIGILMPACCAMCDSANQYVMRQNVLNYTVDCPILIHANLNSVMCNGQGVAIQYLRNTFTVLDLHNQTECKYGLFVLLNGFVKDIV